MTIATLDIDGEAAGRFSLRRIAITCGAGLVAWLVFTELAADCLKRHPDWRLNPDLVNGAIGGLVATAVLYLLFRASTRQAREALDALHKAMGMSSNAICICRVADGTFLKVNHGFVALTGYGESEVLGVRVRDLGLWQDPARFQVLIRELEREGEVRDAEVRLVSKEGDPRVVLLTASLVEFEREPCIIGIIRDISQLRRAEERIEQLSYYDAGTGLPNQNLLMDRLNQLISLNSREHRPAAVIYVGMDGFKGLVDALGHTGSNEVVADLACRLTKALRHNDTVARLHRDELAILLGGELKEAGIDLVIGKIEQAFARPIRIPTGEITIAASLGIACYPGDALTGELLLQHSHAAMNQAREQGESFQYFSAGMNLKAMERLRFESSLVASLDAGEFFLAYQPKYASGGELTGMEALVRWKRQGEIVPPDRFIPLAEENGMIVRLGEWVLREACRQSRSWQDLGFRPLQVSVNISARQLRDNDFVDKVEGALGESGLEPGLLELEITESAIMSVSEEVVLKLLRLKELGVSISIDDFGTGYSSLSYLKHLPVDKIKIDRSFVMDIVSDPNDAAIVDAIISMARALNLSVIAEGVESKGQLDFLIGRQCTEFQGYYFSRPLLAGQFVELLRTRQSAALQAGPEPGRERDPGLPETGQARVRSLYLVEQRSAASRCETMLDVAHPIPPVAPLDRITAVLRRFQREMELKVLPVVDEGTVVGLVNRSTFLEEHIIGRHGFGAHINHAKKIRDLMDPVALSLDAAMTVEEAVRMLQPMIGTLCIDNVCITRNGSYLGVLEMNRFIKSMTEIQMVLAKGANPLTGLPGNTSIEREISRRLESHVPFDVAYIDIDNFKPFNDHYGFQKGDQVLATLAEIMIATSASSPLAEGTFCGHIGGDDFILITESLGSEPLSERIVAAFEAERSAFHGQRDSRQGGYSALNRKGEPEVFPLISLSVGIVNSSLSQVDSYPKLASLSSEVKKAAKKNTGSSIVIEGREARLGPRQVNGRWPDIP